MPSARLLLALLLLPGCASVSRPAPRAVPASELLGTYELVSILGKPLPVREFQAVYYAGEVTLLPDGVYASWIDAETCDVENVCGRATERVTGRWTTLPDGSIQFDPDDHDFYVPETDRDPLEGDFPPPRTEADGREIRYYTRVEPIPVFVYRRR
jgi:hypothetical protein